MRNRGFEILMLLGLFGGAAAFVGLLLPGPAPAAIAWTPPGDTDPPTSRPTVTPAPRQTPPPVPTRMPPPTATPGPTDAPGAPTETPLPPALFVVDVAWPVPPEPIPFPWVGVVDFLRQNVCVTHGGHTVCQGDWVVNTNSSLYENGALRREIRLTNPIMQGDKRPAEPADDVHIPRPQCLVNGEWLYVPGVWYYNGLADVVVEPGWYDERLVHYGPPQYRVGFDVLVRYHRAYVPEPDYPGRTAWNFGALGECSGVGSGGGGEPPPPPPPPAPSPTPPPPPGCPACRCAVSPYGSLESPYLSPWETITLTWSLSSAPEDQLRGFTVRTLAYDGSDWSLVGRREVEPDAPRRETRPIVPGFFYHTLVGARFDVGGTEETCCGCDTYYRYSVVVPPEVGSPEARLDYYSDHDDDPARGPDNPYRTTGPALLWNFGELLHAHPGAEWTHKPFPGWQAQTDVLRWRYRGSQVGDTWRPARCAGAQDASCGWQAEVAGRPTYLHLRWFKNLLPGETENQAVGDNLTWVYVADPQVVGLAYQVQAETTWTNTQTGFQLTWPAFTTTLTVTVDLRHPTTYRGGR